MNCLIYLRMRPQVEDVMAKLRDVAMSPIPSNIKTMLMSVVELRAANWGFGPDEGAPAPDGGPATANGADQLPVVSRGPAAASAVEILKSNKQINNDDLFENDDRTKNISI